MSIRTFTGVVTLSFLLVACAQVTPNSPSPSDATEVASSASVDAESSASSSPALSTRNVSYVGIVSASGLGVYQEGTHTLTLRDGSIVLLRASDLNLSLSAYEGKNVEVRGSVQPTVEAGGTIMSVEEVTVLEPSVSSSASVAPAMCGGIANIKCASGFACVDDLTDDCDTASGGADCSGVCVTLASSSSSSSSSLTSSSSKSTVLLSSTSSSVSKTSSASSSLSTSSVADSSSSGKSNLELQAMSKQNYSSNSLWTQKYCTSHIAFCISVHKNWYFKSFGATTNALWHVEFGMSDIYDLNQGVIILNLMSGPSSASGGATGQVKTIGSDVVGYLDWKGDHFEVTGDSSLKDAIAYMISSIKSYTPGE